MVTIKEILSEFKINLYIAGKYNARRWRTNSKLRKEIECADFDKFETLDEKIWALRNNLPERPICIVCGNKVKLRDQMTGFFKTCSQQCSGLSKHRKEKIKNTALKRYGVEHPTKSEKYRNTKKEQHRLLGYWPGGFNTPEHKKAIKEKYGVEHIGQSEAIRQEIKSTLRERYGVDNPQQNEIIRNKTKETQIKRYGQDGFNPIKTKETLLKRYGVDNPLKSELIKNKIKNTLMERYGVEHPMQNPEIYEKCVSNMSRGVYKFKEYISPLGKKYRVQGYEGNVIDYLIQAGINENEFTNIRTEIPTIEYCFADKKRVYYPDIYVKSKNLLIEVKSTYTFFKDQDKNIAKQFACKNLGYAHIIIIWDKNTNHIFEII